MAKFGFKLKIWILAKFQPRIPCTIRGVLPQFADKFRKLNSDDSGISYDKYLYKKLEKLEKVI